MKRIVIIVAFSFLSLTLVAPVLTQASVTTKHACCQASDCNEGLQAMPCCATPSAPATKDTIVPVSFSSLAVDRPVAQSIPLRLACDKHPKQDDEEAPTEESSLYLLNESFLI